jgi:hypothetical protein
LALRKRNEVKRFNVRCRYALDALERSFGGESSHSGGALGVQIFDI